MSSLYFPFWLLCLFLAICLGCKGDEGDDSPADATKDPDNAVEVPPPEILSARTFGTNTVQVQMTPVVEEASVQPEDFVLIILGETRDIENVSYVGSGLYNLHSSSSWPSDAEGQVRLRSEGVVESVFEQETNSDTAEVAVRAPAAANVRLESVFASVELNQPLDLDPLPGQPGSYLVVEKDGRILLVSEDAEPPRLVADLRDRVNSDDQETGLLSLATAPDFTQSGRLYVYYTIDGYSSVLSRLFYDDGVAGRERRLLEIDRGSPNHFGGGLEFGPDQYLYLSVGSQVRERSDGQALTVLRGKVLRLDVSGDGYSVPTDNPFRGRGEGVMGEILAFGFRNPWRLSFDSLTGQLWVGDVGEDAWEEVNRVEAGGNYGWEVYEGPDCRKRDNVCQRREFESPVAYYAQGEGDCAVIAGAVYRGASLPDLQGWFIFGDFCSGRVRAFDTADPSQIVTLLDSGPNISSFAQDEDGELLVVGFGGIHRLVAESE